jgi:hypothetical protein
MAAGAVIARAIKAAGVIVQVTLDDFLVVIRRTDAPLVVTAYGGFLTKKHQYPTSYKGLAFFTKADAPLLLPGYAEIVAARSIWIPG